MSRDRTAAKAAPASRARTNTVWTPERVEAVCERHAAGTWLKHACALEGGTYDGLIDAMARDPAIAAKVHAAHALGAEARRERMGFSEDWKREAWELERWDRELFHLATKVEAKTELTGANGGGIQIVVGSLEELRRLAANTEDNDV